MHQIFKIFFEDRIFILAKDNAFSPDNSYTIYHYENLNKLNHIITGFEKDKDNNRKIVVFHHDMDLLWKKFKSNFKFICASGGLVMNTEHKYLFIKRLEKWDLPKGKIEKNEKIEHTAIREVGEETGIYDLQIIRSLDSTYHTYKIKDKLILKRTYWFLMKCNNIISPIPQTEENITEARWIDKADLAMITGNTYASLIDVIRYISE
jgi:8-oxo-dGTP pyrophosphatase MutT (NUDIX family)